MTLTQTTLLLTWAVPVIVILCIEILVQSRRADRSRVHKSQGPHWYSDHIGKTSFHSGTHHIGGKG
jgi:cytochrome c-type biogenesis protein CcmH/NrfF